MANYRPKSLSELNTVYDKAMRAEKAIKEGSNLLSVPEKETTPPSENIFTQLENKASEAEKNQVFDPDITNIANDFLKRYAKPAKPKVTPKEVKRPAPSIQSVYHSPAKARQEIKADVPMSTGNDFASGFDAPAVPLHKPAPTMPAVQPPVVREPEIVKEAPAPQIVTAPETPVAPIVPAVSPRAVAAPEAEITPEVPAPAVKAAPQAPAKRFAPRVRITSTERSELMEEYMRVMYDEDDDDDYSYKKPKFSFFKKKKKYEEEINEEPALLYEEYDDNADEDTADKEIPVVPFDNSQVRYTDEYSDAPAEDIISDEEMDVYDYIEADFDYDESEEEVDDVLDISLASSAKEETEAAEETAVEEEIQPEDEEAVEYVQEELPTEITEETEEAEEIAEVSEEAVEEAEAAEAETEDSEEVVVYPEEDTEEAEEVVYPDAPPSDMVFEDIFSVSDENKRSHTGGNWEEVFGANFNANKSEETEDEYAPVTYETEDGDYEEAPVEEYPDYEEYPEKAAEEEQYEEEIKQPKKQIFLKVLMLLTAFVCITAAAATVLITSITAVNTGKIVSDRYRTFSVSENIESLGLSAGDLVITENVYAHTDDRYVYSTDGTYAFGIVSDSTTNELGDYLYETQTENDVVLVNRNNSMGVIVATYNGIGTILAIICDYYIFIAGALLILAVAMIVCFVIISKRKSYTEKLPEYDENDDIDDSDDHNDYEETAETTEYDDYDDTDNYYDYDTDGIEEGLFSDI